MDFRSTIFVCNELEFEEVFIFFGFFFNGKKIKPQGAKKMLMDEML